MSVCGNYVTTFAEASHALPDDMHMNADYPFMIPRIAKRTRDTVTVIGRGGIEETAAIRKQADGKEFCTIAQSSTYEQLFHAKPTKFKFRPFKDETTPVCPSAPGAESQETK